MTSQALLRAALRRAVASKPALASTLVSRTARSALFSATNRFKSTAAIEDPEEDHGEHTPLHSNETFLNGTGSLYAEQMYDAWLADPGSVHETWRAYFENLENGVEYDESQYSNPSVVPGTGAVASQQSGALAVSCRVYIFYYFMN